MHANEPRTARRIRANLDLLVPRGEPGDLEEGVCAVLERIGPLQSVVVEEITRVRPTTADLSVSTTVTVIVVGVDPGSVRQALSDGFGVTEVHTLHVDDSGG